MGSAHLMDRTQATCGAHNSSRRGGPGLDMSHPHDPALGSACC